MQINELKPRQGNVEIAGIIIDKSSPREFNKSGSQGRVCNAKLKDDSGQITLSLWNEQVDQVKVGDKIQIKNGYVSEWQGEMQLSTGKFGTLEVIGESKEAKEEAAKGPDEEEDKKIYEEAEKNLKELEEGLKEEPDYDEEDIKDE